MNYENWVAEMRLLLVELHQHNSDCPPADNFVPPANTIMPLPVLDSRLVGQRHLMNILS